MSDQPVDDLLKSVAARGLRLANLFQFETTTGEWRWQANVTDGEVHWEFGRGSTAAEALRHALFRSANEPGERTRANKRSSGPTTPPAVDPGSLLV